MMAGVLGMGCHSGVLQGACGLPMPGKGFPGKGAAAMMPAFMGKGGAGIMGMGCPVTALPFDGTNMLNMGSGGVPLAPPIRGGLDGLANAGESSPSGLGTSSTLQQDPLNMEGLCEALKEFRRKWDIELRFEPKMIDHLKKHERKWRTELERLDAELKDAQVPPVCRSGYLLVVFGQVTEQNTDEDFRKLLCPNLAAEEKRDADADDVQEVSSGVVRERSVEAPATLEEDWMMTEILEFCNRFKIEEPLKHRLLSAMRSRAKTFKDDMNTLTGSLKGARHPPGLLSLKLREMENGTFQTRGWLPDDQTEESLADSKRLRSKSRDRPRDRSRSRERRREKDRSKSKTGRRRSQSRERRVDRERDRGGKERDRERTRPMKSDNSGADDDPKQK